MARRCEARVNEGSEACAGGPAHKIGGLAGRKEREHIQQARVPAHGADRQGAPAGAGAARPPGDPGQAAACPAA